MKDKGNTNNRELRSRLIGEDEEDMARKLIVVTLFALVALMASVACQPVATPTSTPTATPTATPSPTPPPTPTTTYSVPELEYRLIANFGDVFYCDPDFYPIGRPGQEQQNALDQYPAIRANQSECTAILSHLGLPNKTDYTDQEKLSIYREHKKLSLAVQIAPSGNAYSFTLRVGEGQGKRIEGAITAFGEITVTQTQPSFNTCPICLTKGTLIDTPNGQVPVEKLESGMAVWTQDAYGQRVSATVLDAGKSEVPLAFQVVKVTLADGRSVTASPGHPTADGRRIGDLNAGDTLDGSRVSSVDTLPYDEGETYDLLPSGQTGLYWANGILLKSTMAVR